MLGQLHWMHFMAGKQAGVERTCGKKIVHETEEDAFSAAVHLTKKHIKDGSDKSFEAYPCYFCHHWHVGRQMSMQELIKAETDESQNS